MNKLEETVTSLELSKKLKELGVKQDSFYYWHSANQQPFILLSATNDLGKFWENNQFYSAFTVSELAYMIPKARVGYGEGQNGEVYNDLSDSDSECFELVILFCHVDKVWKIYYESFDSGIRLDKTISDENIVNALAKILIYLIDHFEGDFKALFKL